MIDLGFTIPELTHNEYKWRYLRLFVSGAASDAAGAHDTADAHADVDALAARRLASAPHRELPAPPSERAVLHALALTHSLENDAEAAATRDGAGGAGVGAPRGGSL